MVDQPDTKGLFGREDVSGHQQFKGTGPAYHSGKKVFRTHPRMKSDLGKGETDLAVLGCNPHVTGQADTGPGADGMAVDGGDGRNFQVHETEERIIKGKGLPFPLGRVRSNTASHLFQVTAGAKGTACTGKDKDFRIRVHFNFMDGCPEF